MKKLYILLALVLFASTSFAQWHVYSCDTLPEDKYPETWTKGDNYPGPEYALSIDTVGAFTALNYYQPNTYDPTGQKTSARTTFKMPFGDNTGEITLMIRAKGYGQTAFDADSINTIIEIELRPNSTGFRDKLWFTYEDTAGNYNPTVQLREAAEENAFHEIGDDDWHTFRMTCTPGTENSTFNIFMDENPTAVVTGTTSKANSDNYTKFGDGGSATTGGYVDWIAWNFGGAYAPGEGDALPDGIYIDGVSDVSVPAVRAQLFKMYPNPAGGQVQITGDLLNSELSLYDLSGREVLNMTPDSEHITLDLGDLTTGLYFVKIKSEKGNQIEKLVVE
jgi:Secretion system C-terminal sorting domain